MEIETINALRKQLGEAVHNLSQDSRSQESYLRSIGTWPSLDELALDLDDAYLPLVDNSALSQGELAALGDLSSALGSMSGPSNAQLWNGEVGALDQSEWNRIRELAAKASSRLDV